MGVLDLYLPLIVLLPPVTVGIVLVALIRRRPGDEPDVGIGAARRIFYYAISFITLMTAAIGADSLLRALIEAATGDGRLDAEGVALGGAALVVALPVWALVSRVANRSLAEHRVEAGSISRKMYVYGTLVIALAFITVALYSIVGSPISPESFEPYALTTFAVWMAVAAYLWRVESDEGQPSPMSRQLRSLFIYGGALLGLVLLMIGVWMLGAAMVRGAYDALFAPKLVLDEDPLRIGAGLAVPGALYWALFWHRWSRAHADSPLRIAFIYGPGILAGAAVALTFAALALQQTLEWAFQRYTIAPAEQFESLPIAAGGVFVGLASLGYHAALADALPGAFAASANRIYRYLLAALGLAALSVGADLFIVFALGTFDGVIGEDGYLEASVGIAVLALGAPLWAYHWSRQQAIAQAAGSGELQAPSRRYFVYTVFGAALLTGVGALTAIIFMIIFEALGGDPGGAQLEDLRWPIALLVVALSAGGYYRFAVRVEEPEPAAAAPAPERKRAIVAAADGAAADAIAAALGYRVRFWRTQGSPGAFDAAAVAAAVSNAATASVLIVIDESGASVMPYDEE